MDKLGLTFSAVRAASRKSSMPLRSASVGTAATRASRPTMMYDPGGLGICRFVRDAGRHALLQRAAIAADKISGLHLAYAFDWRASLYRERSGEVPRLHRGADRLN